MNKTVRNKLISMSEENYRKFSKKLIPGCENILGVRVPLIRKYAKELVKENIDWRSLIEEDDIYFEENMLRGFIIGIATEKEDDVKLAKEELKKFIPYINNWSVNDSFCKEFRIIDRYREEFINDIEKMVLSKNEYVSRAGLILLLEHYVKVDMAGRKIARKKFVENLEKAYISKESADYEYKEHTMAEKGKYTDKILECVNRDFSGNGYYTQMAAGWLIAETFVTYPEAVCRFLLDKEKLKLDEESYRKAIRKICESKIPSKEVKEFIKTIKN